VGRGIALDSPQQCLRRRLHRFICVPDDKPIRAIARSTGAAATSITDKKFRRYLAKIDASGQFRVYSTYIGGDLDGGPRREGRS